MRSGHEWLELVADTVLAGELAAVQQSVGKAVVSGAGAGTDTLGAKELRGDEAALVFAENVLQGLAVIDDLAGLLTEHWLGELDGVTTPLAGLASLMQEVIGVRVAEAGFDGTVQSLVELLGGASHTG